MAALKQMKWNGFANETSMHGVKRANEKESGLLRRYW